MAGIRFRQPRLDRSVFGVSTLAEQGYDFDYWFKRGPAARLRHTEFLRRLNFGHAATQGFPRIARFAKRPAR